MKHYENIELLSPGLLVRHQTVYAGLHLSDTVKLGENPANDISQAIIADVSSIKTDTLANSKAKEQAFMLCTHVAITTKQSFGVVSDDLIGQLALRQHDLKTKANALAVIDDKPKYERLITDVFEGLSKAEEEQIDLHACSKMIPLLDKSTVGEELSSKYKAKFNNLLVIGSFAQKNSQHLTKLALTSNPEFIKYATRLTTRTDDGEQAVSLLSDNKGWQSLESATKQDALVALIEVATHSASDDDLVRLAKQVKNEELGSMVISKLAKKSLGALNDKKLAVYLTNAETGLNKKNTEDLHVSLIKHSSVTDTSASQKALQNYLERNDKTGEIRDINTIKSALEKTDAYRNKKMGLLSHNTLIELTQAKVVLESQHEGLDDITIDLSDLANEHSLKKSLAIELANIKSPDEDYKIAVQTSSKTSNLLNKLIETQVNYSINNAPNELNRLLTQDVAKVVKRLDSRQHIQKGIMNDAFRLTGNTAMAKRDKDYAELDYDGTLLNVCKLTQPVINVTTEDKGLVAYAFNDYECFDDLAAHLRSDFSDKSGESFDYTLTLAETNNYLREQVAIDINDFMTEQTNASTSKINKHYTHSVTDFIVDREQDLGKANAIISTINSGEDYNHNQQQSPEVQSTASKKRVSR